MIDIYNIFTFGTFNQIVFFRVIYGRASLGNRVILGLVMVWLSALVGSLHFMNLMSLAVFLDIISPDIPSPNWILYELDYKKGLDLMTFVVWMDIFIIVQVRIWEFFLLTK